MKCIINILLLALFKFSYAQQRSEIFEKHFVKQNKVLFRIIPSHKKMFELINSNSLKVTRYNIVNGNLINETLINTKLKPYGENDTLNWLKLRRKEKNKMAFTYNALYQNKADAKLTPQQKEKHEKMMYDLMLLSCDFDSDVAAACGLFFADTNIVANNNYVYTIALYTTSTSIITKELLNIAVNSSSISTNKNITDLSAKNKNNIINLKWKAANYKSDYSGYNVERSNDSVNYLKINSSPVILLSTQFEKNKEYIFYQDTLKEKNMKYYYRIKGINFFGEQSESSNIVSVFNYPFIKSQPVFDSILVINNSSVYLKWKMDIESETSQLKKYLLLKSEKEQGPYKTIYESFDINTYLDSKPNSGNFYKVAGITKNNDTLYSYSRMAIIIDTIPPNTPSGLKALTDSIGNIRISWNKNKEIDFQGYKLFKSNSKTEEMVQVNSKFIADTFFTDKLKLNTLSKNIYFALSSCDKNYNTSLRCEKIEVKRPDTIRPIAPNLLSAYPGLNGIKLEFIRSESEDVVEHFLFCKNQSKKIKINLKGAKQYFVDSTAQCGNQYSYYITAIDDAGNFSNSNEIEIKYENGYRKKLSDINYSVDRKLQNISLIWNYDLKGIEKFILYRAKENEPLTIIKTLAGTENIYIDKTPNIGNVYEYRIKAVLFNGAESLISDPIKVIY